MFRCTKLLVLLAFYISHKTSHSLPTTEPYLPSSLRSAYDPEEILSKIKNAELDKVTDLKFPPDDIEEIDDEEPHHIINTSQKSLYPPFGTELGREFERDMLIPFPSPSAHSNSRNMENNHHQNMLDNIRISYGLDRISPSSISEELVFLAAPQEKEERTHYGDENIQRSFGFQPLETDDDLMGDEYNFDESNGLPPRDYAELMNPYLSSRTEGQRSLDFSSFNDDDDMEAAESSAAMFRPLFTYRYQKAKRKSQKPPPKRHVSYGSKRRRPSKRHPSYY